MGSADSPEAVDAAIGRHEPVVAARRRPSHAKGVDVIIETTGEVEFGAAVVTEAIRSGKHVSWSTPSWTPPSARSSRSRRTRRRRSHQHRRRRAGRGDEHVPLRQDDRLRPVLAGNIKGFIDQHRTPETQKAFADADGQRPKMVTSFADGTKLALEATMLANAAGFKVAQRGMKGPGAAHVRDLMQFYEPDELLDEGWSSTCSVRSRARGRSSSVKARARYRSST